MKIKSHAKTKCPYNIFQFHLMREVRHPWKLMLTVYCHIKIDSQRINHIYRIYFNMSASVTVLARQLSWMSLRRAVQRSQVWVPVWLHIFSSPVTLAASHYQSVTRYFFFYHKASIPGNVCDRTPLRIKQTHQQLFVHYSLKQHQNTNRHGVEY